MEAHGRAHLAQLHAVGIFLSASTPSFSLPASLPLQSSSGGEEDVAADVVREDAGEKEAAGVGEGEGWGEGRDRLEWAPGVGLKVWQTDARPGLLVEEDCAW